MIPHFDVAICGAGPAGTALACYLAKADYRVALCEQASFPRHQIGESLLPFSWQIFKDVGLDAKLDSLGFIKKYGASFHSQRSERRCRFFFEESLNPQYNHIYHVARDRFDEVFLNHARSLGVSVFAPYRVQNIQKTPERVYFDAMLSCDLMVNASGIGNLSRHPELYVANDDADNRTALYSYFAYDAAKPSYLDGDILIALFYDELFSDFLPADHGNRIPNWAWGIPIGPDVMSIGFVMHTKSFGYLRKRGESLDQIGDLFMERLPAVRAITSGRPKEPFRLKFNFQRVARSIVFDRELLIGDAAGFIDPVFSSGVHIGLNSARLAAQAIQVLGKGARFCTQDLSPYGRAYQSLFWTYYRFVKMFYEKNLVENLFLSAGSRDLEIESKMRQFTSILSGDIATPNPLVNSLHTARLNINPHVSAVFEAL